MNHQPTIPEPRIPWTSLRALPQGLQDAVDWVAHCDEHMIRPLDAIWALANDDMPHDHCLYLHARDLYGGFLTDSTIQDLLDDVIDLDLWIAASTN